MDDISFSYKMEKGFTFNDYDRKTVMDGLKGASKVVRQHAKKLVGKKRISKPGEVPGRRSGDLRRNIKIINSKRKDRLWSRVQVSTIKDKFFYPAVLQAGRKKTPILKPRQDPMALAYSQHKQECEQIIENAVDKAIKVFK